MATVYQDFIPRTIASDVLASVGEEMSAVMKLARTISMPAGVENVPVVSVVPDAAFVTPAYGGRKPRSGIEWTAQSLVPEELAVTLAIPNAFLSDAGFPVWESVRTEIAKAFAKEFDAAALFGTGAPASFPAGGITAAAHASTSDASGSNGIGEGMAYTEAKGLEVDGILGGPILNKYARDMLDGSEKAGPKPSTFYGIPFATTLAFTPGAGPDFRYALVGGWEYVVVGIREDIRYDLSEDGVLTDGAGAVVVNAFQDDSTLMRAYMRVGLALGKPLGYGGTAVKPLHLLTTEESPIVPAALEAEGDDEGATTRKASSKK